MSFDKIIHSSSASCVEDMLDRRRIHALAIWMYCIYVRSSTRALHVSRAHHESSHCICTCRNIPRFLRDENNPFFVSISYHNFSRKPRDTISHKFVSISATRLDRPHVKISLDLNEICIMKSIKILCTYVPVLFFGL